MKKGKKLGIVTSSAEQMMLKHFAKYGPRVHILGIQILCDRVFAIAQYYAKIAVHEVPGIYIVSWRARPSL